MLAPRALNTTKNPINFCSTYLSPVPKRIMCHNEKCGGNEYNILIYQYNFVRNRLPGYFEREGKPLFV